MHLCHVLVGFFRICGTQLKRADTTKAGVTQVRLGLLEPVHLPVISHQSVRNWKLRLTMPTSRNTSASAVGAGFEEVRCC